jgi:TIM-barrel protein
MAGITDGLFCSKLAPQGFDMVTVGGFNVDLKTVLAGKSIKERGRPEFDIPYNQILSFIEDQINIIQGNAWKGMVSVNLRSTTPSSIVEVSEIYGVDVVEINAHCRQPEIMELDCGQSLLHKPDDLYRLTRTVVNDASCKVSVKIRANVPGTDIINTSNLIEDAGADFLHVDAMKPGYPHADYKTISSISDQTDIFLIGNNSIKDVNSAKKMLKAGADGISLARAVINGEVPFNLSSI